MGVKVMTREHLGIAAALGIPVVIALTKIDLCPANILKEQDGGLARCYRPNRNHHSALRMSLGNRDVE